MEKQAIPLEGQLKFGNAVWFLYQDKRKLLPDKLGLMIIIDSYHERNIYIYKDAKNNNIVQHQDSLRILQAQKLKGTLNFQAYNGVLSKYMACSEDNFMVIVQEAVGTIKYLESGLRKIPVLVISLSRGVHIGINGHLFDLLISSR